MLFNKDKKRRKFKTLAYPHIKFLYNMALRYAGNTHDAEDMVQETLFIGFKKFDQLREKEKCKSWLFAILRNVFLKELRTGYRKQTFQENNQADYIQELEYIATQPDAEKVLETKVENKRLYSIIEQMPEKFKSPLLLFYMEDMSYHEISEFLDIPAGTIMSRLSRAKAYLKKALLKEYSKGAKADKVINIDTISR